MIRFERVERIGEGRENFSEEKFSLPSPNPTSPFPKTFDFIESLLQGSAYEKGPSPFPGKVPFFVLRKGRRQRSGVNYTIN